MNPFFKFFPQTIEAVSLYGSGPVSPSELYQRYTNHSLVGCISTDSQDVPGYVTRAARWEVDDFIASQDKPIYEECPAYTNRSSSTESLEFYPYKNYILENALNLQGAQLTGDCTTWMVRLMLDLTRLERMNDGNYEMFYKRCSTVPYYFDRGFNGAGSNPSRQTRLATQIGYVFEQAYGKYDFTSYADSYRIGMRNGTSKVPSEITNISSKIKPGTPKLIKSIQGLLDAQRKRYAIGLGSGMAVKRTGDPISDFSGSWNHAMGHAGHDQTDWCVSTFKDNVTFIDQSWGNWNNVTNIPEKWKPFGQGMFAVKTKQLERHITRGECLCFVPDESQGVEVPNPVFL